MTNRGQCLWPVYMQYKLDVSMTMLLRISSVSVLLKNIVMGNTRFVEHATGMSAINK
jgi:hypothetical protein